MLWSGSRRTVIWFSENRALALREPCSGSQRTVLWFSEKHALVLRETCSGSRRTVLWPSENRALALGEKCSGSRRTVLWLSVNCSPTEMFSSSPNIWIVCLKLKISIYLRWEPKLHFVETCGESIRQIKKNNCIRGN